MLNRLKGVFINRQLGYANVMATVGACAATTPGPTLARAALDASYVAPNAVRQVGRLAVATASSGSR